MQTSCPPPRVVSRLMSFLLLFGYQEAFHCCLVVACSNRINMISIQCHRVGEWSAGKPEFEKVSIPVWGNHDYMQDLMRCIFPLKRSSVCHGMSRVYITTLRLLLFLPHKHMDLDDEWLPLPEEAKSMVWFLEPRSALTYLRTPGMKYFSPSDPTLPLHVRRNTLVRVRNRFIGVLDKAGHSLG